MSLTKNDERVMKNDGRGLVTILKSKCVHTQGSGGKTGEWNLGI
jgi:hypothetical protein